MPSSIPLPTSSDRATEQVDPQREDPGDADGAGQLGDVPRAGQLPRGMPERRTPEDGEPGPQRGLGVIRPRLMIIMLQFMMGGPESWIKLGHFSALLEQRF